ncbi:cellulase family glycosylhydrolase [Mycobacterium sp. MAA66]|uniref:cellulase family glycosylhydrolase n=1 Tax=Mycobacterium sp. MAA66 TaxID=3156297 RepID=UPI003516CCF7
MDTTGNAPAAPVDTPLVSILLAASRREVSGTAAKPAAAAAVAATALTTSTAPVTPAATVTTGNAPAAPAGTQLAPTLLAATAAAGTASTPGATVTVVTVPAPSPEQNLYIAIHAALQHWINSGFGRDVDYVVNRLAGSYVIGNGAAGTAAHPTGGAGGWLVGDGGAGWNSTDAGVAGGAGGRGGLLGDGGFGGNGGAGAAGGAGGTGGMLMGNGGFGGDGGAGAAGVDGGAGGRGGNAVGLLGYGGNGGNGAAGGAGALGGYGGNGGNGTILFGSGGEGGSAGNGSNATGLPALGGAGGNAGWFGIHGTVGQSGVVAGAATTAPGAGALSTTGTWITNSDGQVVIMHGVNEVVKIAPYEPSAAGFDEADAEFLQANGFNEVRLGLDWAAVEPEPGVYDTAYLDSINQTVQMLASHGIYTLLDMHQDGYSSVYGGEGAPAWASLSGGLPNSQVGGFPLTSLLDPAAQHAIGAFWANAKGPNGTGLENAYAQMWQHVASYFNGDPDLAGYEIMNEPYPTAGQSLLSMLGGTYFDAQQLNPFYNQVGAAIRSVDTDTPVYFEPNALFDFGVPTHLGTVDITNTVFSYHAYCTKVGGGCFPNITTITNMANSYAHNHGMPAMMTEFGTIGSTTDYSTLPPSMQGANQIEAGWSDWAFTGQGDITGSPNTEWLVKDLSLPPTGSNVDATKLAILAQPYPQTVSGIPNTWTYVNGTFQFSYSTEKADGSGSFAAGSQTTISTPTVEYPNGYQVTVTGGQVVSAPNAPQLIIASSDGATTVSVVVTAATGNGATAAAT